MTAETQPLDRRRSKAGDAGAAADKAEAAVTDLDHQLTTIAGLKEQQEQALRRAEDEAVRLKRALKVAAKRQTELTRQRKSAEKRASAARAKAVAAEAKYDKEVLAEIVRREKERDRASAGSKPESADSKVESAGSEAESPSSSGPKEVAAGITAAKAAPARRPRRPAAPAPERASEAVATSRRTAARKTAPR